MAACGAAQGADCLLRVGAHNIEPKSNNNPIVSVGSAASLTFNGSCHINPNWAVELLAALPFKHDIYLAGTKNRVGSTEQLPPTLSLQYHFAPVGKAEFYLGAGLNDTFFFNKRTTGALAGGKLYLDSSLGVAAQAGVDFALGKDWLLGLDVRWADINSKASVNLGTSVLNVGTVQIDPMIYGITIGHRLPF
jgi:outer membrane protein